MSQKSSPDKYCKYEGNQNGYIPIIKGQKVRDDLATGLEKMFLDDLKKQNPLLHMSLHMKTGLTFLVAYWYDGIWNFIDCKDSIEVMLRSMNPSTGRICIHYTK